MCLARVVEKLEFWKASNLLRQISSNFIFSSYLLANPENVMWLAYIIKKFVKFYFFIFIYSENFISPEEGAKVWILAFLFEGIPLSRLKNKAESFDFGVEGGHVFQWLSLWRLSKSCEFESLRQWENGLSLSCTLTDANTIQSKGKWCFILPRECTTAPNSQDIKRTNQKKHTQTTLP